MEERCPDTFLLKELSRRREEIQSSEIIPEFTSKRDEGVKMLVNSRIRDLDSKGMSLSGKASAARPQEEGGEACSYQVQKSSLSENNDRR